MQLKRKTKDDEFEEMFRCIGDDFTDVFKRLDELRERMNEPTRICPLQMSKYLEGEFTEIRREIFDLKWRIEKNGIVLVSALLVSAFTLIAVCLLC